MSRTFYIALLFLPDAYTNGIDQTLTLFQSLKPSTTCVFEKYVVDGSITQTDDALDDFISKYPSGERVTISENTSILVEIRAYLISNGIGDIPSFSVNASSPIVKTLTNVLTYGPYEQFSVMSNMMIYTEYRMNKILILWDSNDVINQIFWTTYIDLVQYQANKLSIPVEVDTLGINKRYSIQSGTAILLLSLSSELKTKYVTPQFLANIPRNCYISLTPASTDCEDIFQNIPAFVFIPNPIDYTSTSQLVYNASSGNPSFFFGCYGYFDILYTLDFLTTTTLPLTIQDYLSVNPFTEIPSAFGYSSFDITINGSQYGTFDVVFTKDSIIGNDSVLYNQYNSGGIARLPDSQSIFKSLGIVPFFSTKIFYCNEDYFKFYNEKKELILVRFDKSSTIYKNNNFVVVSENLPCQFIINYSEDGYFSYLQNIFSLCVGENQSQSIVNQTMGKKPVLKLLFEEMYPTNQWIEYLDCTICNQNGETENNRCHTEQNHKKKCYKKKTKKPSQNVWDFIFS